MADLQKNDHLAEKQAFLNDHLPHDARWQKQRNSRRHITAGVVAFALLVNEQGRVADCTVIKTSGAAALDAQSCIVLRQRATFHPALDPAGKPAKDALVGRIRWKL